MLNDFTKSLGFLGENASNMNHAKDNKRMYKFEDERVDKLWCCFFAFYKKGAIRGQIDALNQIKVECGFKVEELMK